MIPFFDGLIPEGWLLEIVVANWKINPKDRMGLLLNFCKNCIGAVSIIKDETEL
jgi:serine/threonine-protein kinase HipA